VRIAQPTPEGGLDKMFRRADFNDVEKASHPLSLYEEDALNEIALVTNHRYKKFARTGHPSGPTKFSFLFFVCATRERDGTPAWS
jgi:hypothetical protein